MTTQNTGNTNSTPQENELDSLMAQIELLKETASPEDLAKLNHFTSQHVANMTTAERDAEKELSKTELLIERATRYRDAMIAIATAAREDGNETDLVWTFRRHKNDIGNWVWNLTSISGARGTNFLPNLVQGFAMTYDGITYNYKADGVGFERDNPGNGHSFYKEPAREVCRAFGLNVSSNGSAGTSLRRQLEKEGDDGTPGAKSEYHNQLDKITVTHPSVNGGKPQKLSEYYLDYVEDNPDTGVEVPEPKGTTKK